MAPAERPCCPILHLAGAWRASLKAVGNWVVEGEGQEAEKAQGRGSGRLCNRLVPRHTGRLSQIHLSFATNAQTLALGPTPLYVWLLWKPGRGQRGSSGDSLL